MGKSRKRVKLTTEQRIENAEAQVRGLMEQVALLENILKDIEDTHKGGWPII